MVSVTDYEICVSRWKKGNLALRIADQPAGHRVVSMLEKYGDPALLALFDDPVEAEIFFLLVEFMKEADTGRQAPENDIHQFKHCEYRKIGMNANESLER